MDISLTGAIVVSIVLSYVLNEVVNILRRETKGAHPLTSILVVIGVLYTLVLAYMVDGFSQSHLTCGREGWLQWTTLLTLFVASGVPMIVGDVMRWLKRR